MFKNGFRKHHWETPEGREAKKLSRDNFFDPQSWQLGFHVVGNKSEEVAKPGEISWTLPSIQIV